MLLFLKLTLVPLLIWGISMAGRVWGPSVAGWLSAFPVVTGPILFFICLEQGAGFGADAASATLLAILAHLSFGLAYAWGATRWPWRGALPQGLGAYVLMLLLLGMARLRSDVSALLIVAVLLIARRLFPGADAIRASQQERVPSRPMLEMGSRMVAGAVLVLVVTWMAGRAGPAWSGLLAMFPVLGVVLAVFSHRQSGAAFAIDLLRNMVWGYFAFATFCVLLAHGLRRHGVAPGFAMAVGGALCVQAASLAMIRRGERRKASASAGSTL